MVVVVLPTPPFWLATAMIRPIMAIALLLMPAVARERFRIRDGRNPVNLFHVER
jgi:hypothetical protein